MAESERKRSKVVFEEEITTDNPDGYANLKLEIEGVSDEKIKGLRKAFVDFWNQIEKNIQEETSLLAK